MGVIVDDVNITGYLEWADVVSNTPAWGIFQDFTPLLAANQWRGDSLTVPHQQGRVPQPVIIDEQTIKFRMIIAGDFTPEGDRTTDAVEGYLANQDLLAAACDPPSILDAEDGCRDLIYHPPGRAPLTQRAQLFLDVSADLKVGTDLIYGNRGALKRAFLTVRLPHGRFEA